MVPIQRTDLGAAVAMADTNGLASEGFEVYNILDVVPVQEKVN